MGSPTWQPKARGGRRQRPGGATLCQPWGHPEREVAPGCRRHPRRESGLRAPEAMGAWDRPRHAEGVDGGVMGGVEDGGGGGSAVPTGGVSRAMSPKEAAKWGRVAVPCPHEGRRLLGQSPPPRSTARIQARDEEWDHGDDRPLLESTAVLQRKKAQNVCTRENFSAIPPTDGPQSCMLATPLNNDEHQ